jgi:hypothetical protein
LSGSFTYYNEVKKEKFLEFTISYLNCCAR